MIAFAGRMWWEAFERVSLGNHRSKYPHRVLFTATEQILIDGDLWDYSLSALESYHAEVICYRPALPCPKLPPAHCTCLALTLSLRSL